LRWTVTLEWWLLKGGLFELSMRLGGCELAIAEGEVEKGEGGGQ
jgi:hypothetical protein